MEAHACNPAVGHPELGAILEYVVKKELRGKKLERKRGHLLDIDFEGFNR